MIANSEPGFSLSIHNEPRSAGTTELNLSKMSRQSRRRRMQEERRNEDPEKIAFRIKRFSLVSLFTLLQI